MCIHDAHIWLHKADAADDCLHPSTWRSIPPYRWGLIVSQVRHPAVSQYGRLVSQRRVRSHLEARDNLNQAQSRLLGRVTLSTGSLDHGVTDCNHHRKSWLIKGGGGTGVRYVSYGSRGGLETGHVAFYFILFYLCGIEGH